MEFIKTILNSISVITGLYKLFTHKQDVDKQQLIANNILESIGQITILLQKVSVTPSEDASPKIWKEYFDDLNPRYEQIFILKKKLILQTNGKINKNDLRDLHGYINGLNINLKEQLKKDILDENKPTQTKAIDSIKEYRTKLEELYNKLK